MKQRSVRKEDAQRRDILMFTPEIEARSGLDFRTSETQPRTVPFDDMLVCCQGMCKRTNPGQLSPPNLQNLSNSPPPSPPRKKKITFIKLKIWSIELCSQTLGFVQSDKQTKSSLSSIALLYLLH